MAVWKDEEDDWSGQWCWPRTVQLKMQGLPQQRDNQSLARWHKKGWVGLGENQRTGRPQETGIQDNENGKEKDLAWAKDKDKGQAIGTARMRKGRSWHNTDWEKWFKCDERGKAISSKDKLRRHIRNIHENEKWERSWHETEWERRRLYSAVLHIPWIQNFVQNSRELI